MIAQLVQLGSLNIRLQGLRDRFALGGRWGEVISVLLVLAGCVLLLALIHRRQRTAGRPEPDSPPRLFRTLLKGLGLTAQQRSILRGMATDLRLEHPTVMLLSPKLFQEQTAAWAKTRRDVPTGELAAIARRIFQTVPQR